VIEIPLTRGQVALIDDDCAILAGFNWRATWHRCVEGFYGVRSATIAPGKRSSQYLHRAVMELKLGRLLLRSEFIDHINHATLDCRSENLRRATRAENNRNARLSRRNTSGYKGVSWDPQARKWVALIMADRKRRFLGLFETAEEAGRAYDAAARELHGEFALTNSQMKR